MRQIGAPRLDRAGLVSILIPRCRGMRHGQDKEHDRGGIRMFQSSSPVAGGCDSPSSPSGGCRGRRFNPHPPLPGDATSRAMMDWAILPTMFQSSSPVAGGLRLGPLPRHSLGIFRFNPHPPLPGDATRRSRCEPVRCCSGFNPHPPLPGDATSRTSRPKASSPHRFQSSSPVAGGCDLPSGSTDPANASCFNPHPPLPGDATGHPLPTG